MRVVSLFAGCGGLDLGLQKAGHTIVYASDFDANCKKTYDRNFDHPLHLEDVKDVKGDNLPEHDIVTGGFPCQGFSVANLYRKVEDKRNELYLQLVRLIGETHPRYFLAENVPGLLSIGEGKVAKMILSDFKNIGVKEGGLGYEVHAYLLNACDYGVPQGRKRVIFLGVSKDVEEEQRNILYSNFPPKPQFGHEGQPPYKTLRDAIGDLPEPYTPEGERLNNHVGTNHKVRINGYMGNRKLDWDKVSPTITGRGGGTGGPVIPVHPNCQRRFTVREAARIQSFPDDFVFEGCTTAQFRQIGNAVAVDFACQLGKVLKAFEEGKLKMDRPLGEHDKREILL